MEKNRTIRWLAFVASASLSVMAMAQEAPSTQPAAAPATATDSKQADAEAKMAAKKGEIAALREQAKEVSKAIGKLASEGNLPTDEEALAVMRQLVEQLEDINERLERLEGEVKDIQGWVEGTTEALPIMNNEIVEARRFRPTMYTQFQFRNSDRQVATAATRPTFFGTPFSGARERGVAFRRLRFGATYNINAKTLIRFSMDGSTGAGNDAFQLRDAAMVYTILPSDRFVATEFTAGQFALPLGYELERSSADREFPERAQYNRVMFNGERIRGGMIRHAVSDKVAVTLGLSSTLTFLDPEQVTRASMPDGLTAVFGAVRYETPTVSAGISHFAGDRPAFRTAGSTGTATSGTLTVVTAPRPLSAPKVARKFTYLDASFIGFIDPKLTLRFEGMRGSDRVPVANTQNSGGVSDAARIDADNMSGWQLQGTYNVSDKFQLYGRFESFDPDTATDDNAITGWGGGFRYFMNPGASISLTAERFRVPQLAARRVHTVYTLRYQFRF